MMRAAVITSVVGILLTASAPAQAEGVKTNSKRVQRTPLFATNVGKKLPVFVRARLAASYLRRNKPGFEQAYESELKGQKADRAKKLVQRWSNAALTLTMIPGMREIVETAQSSPGTAIATAGTFATIYAVLNWRFAADRRTSAARNAANSIYFSDKRIPHEGSAIAVIRQAWEN